MNSLKIKLFNFPLKQSIRTNVCTIRSIDAIAVFLDSEQGAVGNSFIHVLGEMPCSTIIEHIKKIHTIAISKDAFKALEKWEQFWLKYSSEKKRQSGNLCACSTRYCSMGFVCKN